MAVNGKAIFAALICLYKNGPFIQIEVKSVVRRPMIKSAAIATGTKCSLE